MSISVQRTVSSSEVARTTSLSQEKMNHRNVGLSTETEEDAASMVILSIIFHANRVGAAYYDTDTCCLFLMPDHIEMAPNFTVIKMLLKQADPCAIVTSNRTDESVITILKEINAMSRPTVSSSTSIPSPIQEQRLHLLPNIDFALEASKHRLQNLDFSQMPKNMNDAEKKIYFSSLLDFSNICMVKAAGGLLKFVESHPFGHRLESASLSITSITTLSLKSIVDIDENSFRALQIFQEERHPSVYKSTFGIKEGLSLYGICNKCRSTIGKKELKRWFLLPSNDPKLIKERQDAIKYFVSPKNMDVVAALQNSLKHIKYLPRILTRMKTAQASINDWQSLYKTSYHAMCIGEICRSRAANLKIFNEIKLSFSTDLFRISSLLNKIIDFEEYMKQNHFVVKPGVDSELDKMKRTYNGLPDFMTQVAYQELQDLGQDVEQCSVIYLPQLGYLLAIPVTEKMKETKDYSLSNLRFMFVVNDIVHYKSSNTKKLDSLLGDTLCEIYDKETQIMHKLQNVILEMQHVLLAVMEYSAILDCLIALATAAKEFNWIQPEISTDGDLAVVKGRHPLQEMCVTSFMANDAYSGGSESKIKILTGPNSSGKSIYLKQVVLIAYMAHLGSYVPAQSAKIPILDKIFTCIHSIESVSLDLSGFLISLNQLSFALTNASKKSLVIVDEFGKDTEEESGLNILTASLNFWIENKHNSPHIFLVTHFQLLCTYFNDCSFVKFQTLEMMSNEEPVFLYQLTDGVTTSSFATHTASLAGLSKNVINRSRRIINALKMKEPIQLEESSFVSDKLLRYSTIFERFLRLKVQSDDLFSFFKFLEEASSNPDH